MSGSHKTSGFGIRRRTMFGMGTTWKSSQVSVALIFEVLMYSYRRGIVAINRHLLQQCEKTAPARFSDSLHCGRLSPGPRLMMSA